MSLISFIFYIKDAPYDCGCYYDCNCPSRESYIKIFNNLNDAAEFISDILIKNQYHYVNDIIVNGIQLNTKPILIIKKSTSKKFFNPINFNNEVIDNEVNKWFPDEFTDNPDEYKVILPKSLGHLNELFTLTETIIAPHLHAESIKLKANDDKLKEDKRNADLKKLAELKMLYPEA